MPTVSFTTSGALRKSALREANERLVLDSIRQGPRDIARRDRAKDRLSANLGDLRGQPAPQEPPG